jgi:hypothetical protein
MRVLLLNQAFYPDVVSTAQHAADLAAGLADAGHEVTVLASRHAYDDPLRRFPARELWRGVTVLRAPCTALGKRSLWRRAIDFASFLLSCIVHLAFLHRFDVVIAMTSPPLIAVLAALFVRSKGGALVSWIMDLNPDEAIAAGALRRDSLFARGLSRLLRFSLAASAMVVVLDRFMRDRVVAKGVPAHRVAILPPWSHSPAVHFDERGRDRFRDLHALMRKFVVMYSGNHSPCHPLDTVLHAARDLRTETDIAFAFIGGGSEFRKVVDFAAQNRLRNIACLPYQPLASLADSLSAADLHLVVMGDAFAGIVHPCKIYNVLAVGSPSLYIGPRESHITELATFRADHGDVAAVTEFIRRSADSGVRRSASSAALAEQFAAPSVVPQIIAIVEDAGRAAGEGATVAAMVS